MNTHNGKHATNTNIESAAKKRKQGEDTIQTSTRPIIIDIDGTSETLNTISTTAPKSRAITAFIAGIESLHGPARLNHTVTEMSRLFVENLTRLNTKKKKIARFSDASFTPHSIRINCTLNGSKTATEGDTFKKLSDEFEEYKASFIEQARDVMFREQELEQRIIEQEIRTQILTFAKTLILDDVLARGYAESLENIQDKEVTSLLAHSITTNKAMWTPLLFGVNDYTLCQSLEPKPDPNLDEVNNKYKGVSIRIIHQLQKTFVAALTEYDEGIKQTKIAEEMTKHRESEKLNNLTETVMTESEKIQSNLDADTVKAIVKAAINEYNGNTTNKSNKKWTSSSSNNTHNRKGNGTGNRLGQKNGNRSGNRQINKPDNRDNGNNHRQNNRYGSNNHNGNGNGNNNRNGTGNNNRNGNGTRYNNRNGNNTGNRNRNNNGNNVTFHSSVKDRRDGDNNNGTNNASANRNQRTNRNTKRK